jgi:hypothetical protein
MSEEEAARELFSIPIPALKELLEDWLSNIGGEGDHQGRGRRPIKSQPFDLNDLQESSRILPPAFPREQGEPAAFQLKITIRDLKPPVWRRILIPSTATFAELHDAIQEAFGWEDCHLHEFTIRAPKPFRHEYRIGGVPPDGDVESIADFLEECDYREDKVRLGDFLSLEAPRATYTYDFGDNWDHAIVLEQVLPLDSETEYPDCVKEKGRTPPEDSGGPWGYMEDRDDE